MIKEIDFKAVTRSWKCPKFARLEAAAETRGEELPMHLQIVPRENLPPFISSMVPEWQLGAIVRFYEGQPVYALWWVR